MNYGHLFPLGIRYSWRIAKQYHFLFNEIKPLVLHKATTLGLHFTPIEQRILLRNYPLYAVCTNGENYSYLSSGRSLNYLERKRITLMSIMACLCDDLIDEEQWTMRQLLDLLYEPTSLKDLSQKAQLILYLNEIFKASGNIQPIYWQQLAIGFEAQIASLKQFSPDLSLEETVHITKEKGGQSNLLIGYLLDRPLEELEVKIVYQAGVLGQLVNDIFDVYKDLQQNIYTVLTKVSSIEQLKAMYMAECKNFNSLIKQTAKPASQQLKMLQLAACIPAFGLVALEQLARVEAQYKLPPSDWNTLPRKPLIVDMEQRINQLNLAKFTLLCANL